MTITNPVTRVEYLGDGATVLFAVTFPFFDDEDLAVYTYTAGVQTLLTLGLDYTVSGGEGSTGSVTTVATYANTVTLIIERSTQLVQQSDYDDQASIPAETLESDFDRGVMRDLEIMRELTRSLRFPAADPLSLNATLPPAAARVNGVLLFDAFGNATVAALATLVPGAIVVGAPGQTLLPLASMSAWVTALGAVKNAGSFAALMAGAAAGRPGFGALPFGEYLDFFSGRSYFSNGVAWFEAGLRRVRATDLVTPNVGSPGGLYLQVDDGEIFYDTGTAVVVLRTPFERGAIGGLTLTRTATTVTIAPGDCRVGTAANRSQRNALNTAAFTKAINATWAAGSGSGGRAAGVGLAADTWYHVFIIRKPNSNSAGFDAIDFVLDTNIECANGLADAAVVAAGFGAGTTYRRIGSIRTDGASAIIDFVQTGDEFRWIAPPALESSTDANQSGADKTLLLTRAPTGVKKQVRVRTAIAYTGGSNIVCVVGSDETIGAAPAALATPLANFRYDSVTQQIEDRETLSLLLDANNTVKFRASGAGTIQLHTQVIGWTDRRGADL